MSDVGAAEGSGAPAVTFAGIEANTGVRDVDGNEWVVSSVDGWDSPVVRVATIDRPGADGAFVGDAYYGPRAMTVKGSCISNTGHAGVLAARTRLAAALDALLRTSGLIVVGEGPDKQAAVRRGAALRIDVDQQHLIFEAALVAADPRKYAADQSTLTVGLPTAAGGLVFPVVYPASFGPSVAGGGGAAVNSGTVPTWPTATFTGPATSPAVELVETGERVTVDIVLGAGEELVVDMLTRTVVLEGTASRRSSLRAGSRWWALPPGSSTVRFAAAAFDPSARLTLAWRSAWQ